MATFVWSNFGGAKWDSGLYDISASFTTGLYSHGSEIGASTSMCNCGNCRSCKVYLREIISTDLKMEHVHNVIDPAKNDFSKMTEDFYRYLHESIKQIYGAENVIIFGRNIVIKETSISVKAIFALFEHKAKLGGYVYVSSPLKNYPTHFPLQLGETDREKLIKFLC